MDWAELYGTEEIFEICHEIYNTNIVCVVFGKLVVYTIIYPSHLNNVHSKNNIAGILQHTLNSSTRDSYCHIGYQ